MTIVVLQTSPRCSMSRLGIAPMELNSRLDHRGQADVPALLPAQDRRFRSMHKHPSLDAQVEFNSRL